MTLRGGRLYYRPFARLPALWFCRLRLGPCGPHFNARGIALFTHIRVALKDYYHTGTPVPSTPTFARLMTRECREALPPRRILEVGPGAGPMTEQIVACLGDGDVFDVVEINADFARNLDKRFLGPARKRVPGATIRMFIDPIQTAALEGGYGFIVSSLPLNNFEPQEVREILARMKGLLAPGGHLSFFEYAGIRRIARPFKKKQDRRRLGDIGRLLTEFDRENGVKKRVCLLNFPPALKRSLQLKARS